MSLMQMSLSGGMLILVIILIRVLAVHRLSKRLMAALWGAVCARLLIPFAWPSQMSVFRLFSRGGPVLSAEAGSYRTLVEEASVGLPLNAPAAQTPELSIWFWVWLAGALGCALWFGTAFVKNRKRF